MDKPQPQIMERFTTKDQPKERVEFYDYRECREYLQEKYGYDERDYAGKYQGESNFDTWCNAKRYGAFDPQGWPRGESQIWYAAYRADLETGLVAEKPYQDFWHFVIDRYGCTTNESFFTMFEEGTDDAEDWQKKILGYYMDEFGTGEKGQRVIEFYVWW